MPRRAPRPRGRAPGSAAIADGELGSTPGGPWWGWVGDGGAPGTEVRAQASTAEPRAYRAVRAAPGTPPLSRRTGRRSSDRRGSTRTPRPPDRRGLAPPRSRGTDDPSARRRGSAGTARPDTAPGPTRVF